MATGLFNFDMATEFYKFEFRLFLHLKKKEKSEFKLVKFCLKVDLVLRVEGVGKYIKKLKKKVAHIRLNTLGHILQFSCFYFVVQKKKMIEIISF